MPKRERNIKHFDLSHLEELADVLIPFIDLKIDTMDYYKSHPIKPLMEDTNNETNK